MAINGVNIFSSGTKVNNIPNKQKKNDIKYPRGDTLENSNVLQDADFNIISDELRRKRIQIQIGEKLNNLRNFTEN